MLTNAFAHENRTVSTLSPRAKRERAIYFAISTVLFIIAAFMLFEFLYLLCNMIGSIVSGTPSQAIVELLRMLPQIVLTFAIIHITVYLRCAYFAKNAKRRIAAFKINGVISAVFGLFVAGYVIVGVITGQYGELVEGHPSLLFPLDIMLGGLLLVAHGVLSFLYGERVKKGESELPYREERHNIVLRIVNAVLYTLGYFVVLFSTAALCLSPIVMDFTKGNLFFNFMMILVHLMVVLGFVFYIFVFGELKAEHKVRVQRYYSLIFLAVNLVFWALFVVSLHIAPEAPNLNAFGLLPIEYAASVNVFPIVYLLLNVISPLAAFLKSLGKKIK